MLERVKATNFLSWSNLDFKINSGVTLIDGWNEDDQTSEGSGKSAVLNAISWCCFGKIPKETKIDDVIKTGTKSCSVEVEFSDNLKILRSRNPNSLAIIKGNKSIKGKDAKETQSLIESKLGLSFESFCQSIYFSQNYPKKFISSSQEEKARILSEIQDLAKFDIAKFEAHRLVKLEDNSLNQLTNKVTELRGDKNLVEREIRHAHEIYNVNLENHNKQKLNIETKLKELSDKEKHTKDKILELDSKNIDTAQLESDLEELKSKLKEVKSTIANYDSIIRSIKSKDNEAQSLVKKYKKLDEEESKLSQPTPEVSTCPTCGSKVSSGNIELKKSIESKKSDILTEKEYVKKRLVDIETEKPREPGPIDDIRQREHSLLQAVSEVKSKINEINEVNEEINRLKYTVETLQMQRRDLNNTLSSLGEPVLDRDKLSSLSEKLKNIESSIDSIDSTINDKKIYISRLETLKKSFKEVKTYIFDNALIEIANKANQYAQSLFEVPVHIDLSNDNMKINVDVMIDGDIRPIGLLSGGQFRRVSLAVDLALSDLVSSRKSSKFGVLVLDEYFKDLSEPSMEKCLSLLESRKSPVLLIEHNSIFKSVVDNQVSVKYSNKTSTLENS